MQNLYDEVTSLDKRCYEEFALNEDILMEHASDGMAQFIRNKFKNNSSIIVVCGGSNNGADGIALARLLHIDYDVSIFYAKKPSSPMAILQNKRALAIGVKECKELEDSEIIVDALFGTGFSGEFNQEISNLMKRMNSLESFKIACDIPSGLRADGTVAKECFVADISLTMGALKKSMFLDEAKDFVGEIKVLDLGVAREIYEIESNWKLLESSDLKLPFRTKKDSHKGSFGHLALACGDKSGASIMSASSALKFGAGLVTLVGYENHHTLNIPYSIMYSHTLPSNTTAIGIGMGLGSEFSDIELNKLLDNELPLVVDADIFYIPSSVNKILKRKNIVLTPHPKEFIELLKITNIADISIDKLQKNRFKYVEIFCKRFPDTTLLLKGANVIVAQKKQFFINPNGSSALAKGGSGDVLSGLIASLLAQNFTPLESAINGSLTHTQLVQNFKGANFSLTPDNLIEGISNL